MQRRPAALFPSYGGKAQVLIAWASEPFAAFPAWTDVTSYVRLERGISVQSRGRQDNISTVQAGRLTLTVDNSNGEFTVGRSGSPWYPNVKIGRRIQVNIPDENGVLRTRFDGLITELPTAWEGPAAYVSLEDIQASDILAWLGRQPELLSWTQQEMLADAPVALWSLADTSSVTSAADQAGQGAQPLQVVSQGDGTGAASAGSGVPLAEVQSSGSTAQLQQVQTYTFTTPGAFSVTFPAGTLVSCKAECWGGGQAGTNGNGVSTGGTGGGGAEYAAEPALAVTPGLTYTGTVGGGGAPSGGSGGDTTFAGDSVTVTAHASGAGSANTTHFSGGAGAANSGANGGGGGGSGGQLAAGNHGLSTTSAAAVAVTGGGGGGAGDTSGAGAGSGAAPGGGGGGGHAGSTTNSNGGGGGSGQVVITYTYVPPASSQQNSSIPSWLFTPSATLAARVLSGPLPLPAAAASGFAFECWAAFAAFPAAAVTTLTTPGSFTFTAPPGATTADVACWAGGTAGVNGNGVSVGGAGGNGGEYAEEAALALTPNSQYAGSVGAAGAPSGGTGGNTTFTGDAVTVLANGSGSGSTNTKHNSGGSGGAASGANGGGGGGSGGTGQAGNSGLSTGGTAGAAVAGGGAGGAGDASGAGPGPGASPGGGGGGGKGSNIVNSNGGTGGAGQAVITVQPGVSCLLTLAQPRGQNAIAVWVTSAGHLQLASTSGYGTRSPSWTTVDAGVASSSPSHIVVSVAASTRIATLYVNGVSKGTLTLPAGAAYSQVTIGGAWQSWLGGWNGSAGLLAVYPATLSSARTGVHYAAGSTGFAGSSTGTLISKIAAYAGLPSFWYAPPAGPSDPSYGLGLTSYYDIKGQNPLTAMQALETAEGGVLSVNAAGRLVFADRASRYAAGAAASAFTLQAGQYAADTSFKSNDQYLTTEANYATVNLPGGYPVANAAAEADFGPYTQQAGTPNSAQAAPFADATGTAGTYSTDDIMDAGWWTVNVLGQPTPRVPAVTVDLLTLPASEFSIAAFYALDIGSAVQLAGLPSQAPDSTGQPLASYVVIEGVSETLDPDKHEVQLYTSPLAQNAAWIPGDSLLGVLDSTAVTGRSQAPAALGPPYTPVPAFGGTLNRTGSVGAQDLRTLTVNTQNRLTPPLLIAQQASAQTLATAAGQPVSFDTLQADTAGGMGTTLTYTIPAGYAGWYWLAAVVQAATGTASLGGLAVWFSITLSGVNSQWHARNLPYLSTAPYTAVGISGKAGPFSAGDTIQVITAWSGTATSVPLGTSDGGSMLTLMWEGYT
jgi:hypothetical protein